MTTPSPQEHLPTDSDTPVSGYSGTHVSRSWSGHDLFTAHCPCEVAPCGLAIAAANDCPQHSARAGKTIRNSHSAAACPGANR